MSIASDEFGPAGRHSSAEYFTRLQMAKTLADNGHQLALDLDTAFGYVSAVRSIRELPPVPRRSLFGRTASMATLPAERFFGLTEALSVMLEHGDDDIKNDAAVTVTELWGIMGEATQSDHKFTILRELINLEPPAPVTNVAQQLADRYLCPPESTDKMRQQVAADIMSLTRLTPQ